MVEVESYQGLARKWRPQTLADLVGQEAVALSLGNALRGGRVVHGHLLAGPRGTGKTTTARILAKALNCEKGPTDTPCGQCVHCVGITAGSDLDVIEIDAASNTGVDNIRELRERVIHAPFAARHKVYIIDEIHMLSMAAFNALLKTLEEPPPFVVFVFATTELEKVPETIRSRCVVHLFRRLNADDITRRLMQVARGEGIKLPEAQAREVYGLIARSVDGGMRDALVLLDQLLALTEGKPDAESAIKLLGLADRGVLVQTVDWLARGEAAQLLGLIDDLVARGRSLERFTKDLVAYLRALMLLQAGADDRLLDLTGDALESARAQAGKLAPASLLNMLNHLFQLEERLKQSTQARFLVEFTLLRLASVKPVVPIDDILRKMQALPEGAFTSTGSGGSTQARADASASRPARRSTEPSIPASAAMWNDSEPVEQTSAVQSVPRPLPGDAAGLLEQLLPCLPDSSRFLARYLRQADGLSLEGAVLRVHWRQPGRSLARRMLERTENVQVIEAALAQLAGRPIRLMHEEGSAPVPSPASIEKMDDQTPNDPSFALPPVAAFHENRQAAASASFPPSEQVEWPSPVDNEAEASLGPEDAESGWRDDANESTPSGKLDLPRAPQAPPADRRTALEKARALFQENAEAARRIRMARDFFGGKLIDEQGKPLPIS